MIIESIKNIKSGKKEIKEFAVVMAGFCCVLGIWMFLKGNCSFPYFFIVATVITGLYLIMPRLLIPFQKIWMSFGVFLGTIMTFAVLTALFYLVVTPISLLKIIFSKDGARNKTGKSLWAEPEFKNPEKSWYEKQY